MNISDYHAKYFAYELTKRCASDSLEKRSSTLSNAQVDLNPHQIEAALFAFCSPLSKGAILADEVGLGKTIEAGLVLSQKWAERKRKILLIVPSSLRKQWNAELQEKFFLPSVIPETKSFNQYIKDGNLNPFNQKDVIVISSKTADSRAALVAYFKNEAEIMIATEAGAEGVNLQFCSLIINYDLPWNPQRIEQRVGRCHRYGQKHDVVVINFVNRKNADFAEHEYSFTLKNNPFPNDGIDSGPYKIGKNVADAHVYRPGHPLARK